MPRSRNIFVVAGEASGDLHGGKLVHALKSLDPLSQIFGIGGDRMAQEGMELLFHTRDMAVVGFTEVIRHLPFLRRVMQTIERELRRRSPEVAILIDYPGFNLRLAKRLRAAGVKVLYYIAPQVWAWGARRIHRMAMLVDAMAVVFPFEVELFSEAGIPTTFVGHPLLEGLQPDRSSEAFLRDHALDPAKKILGLLPGSRHEEVQRLLPDMIATARLVQRDLPELQIVVAKASHLADRVYRQSAPDEEIKIVEGATYELMRDSTACLVCSGTATLETACFGTPMAIVYRVSSLTYQIAKRLVSLPHIGLVNVVANRKAVPEFVQDAFQPPAVAETMRELLVDQAVRSEMIEALSQVRSKLGTPGASIRTAELALNLIDKR